MANLELDALQPKTKSIVLLALMYCESDDLFQQLLSVDSALEALEESLEQLAEEAKDIHGGSEFDDEYYVRDLQSSDLVKSIGKFEELQTTVRGRFNLRAQKLLQGIRTRSFPNQFPDEVLLHIVNCFESTLDKSQLYLDKGFASNIKTIQSIRLTCRRLCEISSHLLVPCMHITPTLSSLEHLDQVLSHPLISRGLRLLCVSVPILEAGVAEDFNRFCDLSFDKLLNLLECYYPYPHRPEAIAKRIEDFMKKDDHGHTWYHHLHELKEFSLINFDNDANLDLPRLSLRRLLLRLFLREHVRYRELHQKQEEILWSDRLTRTVAAAAARSPSGICLHITDTLAPTDLDGHDPYNLRKALDDDPSLVVDLEFLIKSTRVLEGQRWQELDVDHTSKFPQSILYELPLAICAAGATLTGFVINTSSPFNPPFPILNITQEQISVLGRVFKNLEAFKISMPGYVEGEGFSSYLSAVTGARKIRDLSLGLGLIEGPMAHPSFNPFATVPVRISGTWDRLETLTLVNYAMHLNELRGLLGVLKPGVNILFDGIELLSGTWEEALGYIRSKAGPGSQVIVPGPWDCVIMSESDYWEIFENDHWGYVVTLGRARRLRVISDV